MAATYYEKPPNPQGVTVTGGGNANAELQVPYLVFGAADEAACNACLSSNAPGTRAGLVRVDWTMNEIADQTWDGEVRYVPATVAPPPPPPATNDDEFEFDTTGIMTRKTYGQEIGVWVPTGGDDDITFGGAINVKQDKNGAEVEGVDVGVRAFEFSVTLYLPDAALTEGYLAALYNQSWTVNAADIAVLVQGRTLRFKAGELLFKGCTGRKRRSVGDWPLTFHLAGSPNMEDIPIGPAGAPVITVGVKNGWDYLWVQFADDATSKSLIKKPKCAVVNRVYDRSNFMNLNLPSPSGP